MTIITKKITTEIEVDGIEDIVNEVLSREHATAEAVRAIQKRLKQIVMPWSPDGCIPHGYVRRLGTGEVVGEVSARLGGFANPHRPREHGWGYEGTNPRGQGACTSGIVEVRWAENFEEFEIKEAEIAARDEAMSIVDSFLISEFPDLVVLKGVEEKTVRL